MKMHFNEDGFYHWLERLGDIRSVENMINHIHIYDIVGGDDINEVEFEIVGDIFFKSLSVCLKYCFPSIDFDVSISSSDEDYGPTVTFSQKN